ncbi:MAG: hypothetical protein ABFD25_19215 [Clostridiaceae bacterium]
MITYINGEKKNINKDGSVYSHIAGPITKEQILKAIDDIRKADTAKQ